MESERGYGVVTILTSNRIDMKRDIVFLLMSLMTAIAASAQVNVVDSVEEWIPDSIEEWIPDSVEECIEIDTTATNDGKNLEISEYELTDRYGLIVTGSKYGIRDFEKNENVTEVIYDDAAPAFRRRVEDEYITYFYIRQGECCGIVSIFESTNHLMTIMSSSDSSN